MYAHIYIYICTFIINAKYLNYQRFPTNEILRNMILIFCLTLTVLQIVFLLYLEYMKIGLLDAHRLILVRHRLSMDIEVMVEVTE